MNSLSRDPTPPNCGRLPLEHFLFRLGLRRRLAPRKAHRI
jgi:hypothetical protein